MKNICVLDAFAGEGTIWDELKNKISVKELVSLEKKKGLNTKNIVTDNVKWMQRNCLEKFNVIDLDSYSSPTEQIRVLIDKKYKGTVFFTFIQMGFATLPFAMLIDLYKSVSMVRKMRTMFIKDGFAEFQKWLKMNGVSEISFFYHKSQGGKKYYGFFDL